MSSWNDGYVSEINYVFGYTAELNTARLKQIFLNAGLAVPEIMTACELGFGQGLTINIHAAATNVAWYGTDFNPSQAAFAQDLTKISGANAHLLDDSFAEFSQRQDLPQFDYIGLHGIWSWISDANRAVIVDFISRKLRVGGVLYISYNTLPGWAGMVPIRSLLTEYKEKMSAPGQGLPVGIDSALTFAERLIGVSSQYAQANPQLAGRVAGLKKFDRHYLAHEYFNRDWMPMSFARMTEWLAPTKLSYAFSAHSLDHVDAVNLTAEQQSLLGEIPDPNLRETVRDFCVNQQFRRDYWVKGKRQLTPVAQMEQQRIQRFMLVRPRAKVSLKIAGVLGQLDMLEAIYVPLLDMLADYRPHPVSELESALKSRDVTYQQLIQALTVLTGTGAIMAVQDDVDIDAASIACAKLNSHLCQLALTDNRIDYLASPVTGSGIIVSRIEKMFILALAAGHNESSVLAGFAWDVLSARGERMRKDDKTLESDAENQAELQAQATAFLHELYPVLQALKVI